MHLRVRILRITYQPDYYVGETNVKTKRIFKYCFKIELRQRKYPTLQSEAAQGNL